MAVSPATRTADETATTLDEILSGDGVASLVDVLDLMDLACGRTAYRHSGKVVVTASFEQLRLLAPIPRGAHVRVSSRIVATGRTSLLLRVQAEAEDISTLKYTPIVEAYSTFVCVAKDGNSEVPILDPVDESGTTMKARLSSTRKHFARIEKLASPLPAIRGDLVGDSKDVLPAASGVLVVSKQYLPRHQNFAGAVFGGDLLETTTRVASYAAARLSRGLCTSPQCIALKYFSFVKPMMPLNLWRITARVAAIRGAVIYVEVRADIDENHDGKVMTRSHDGLFAMLLADVSGKPLNCPVQIDFEDADDHLLRAHLRAALWVDEETLIENVLQLSST